MLNPTKQIPVLTAALPLDPVQRSNRAALNVGAQAQINSLQKNVEVRVREEKIVFIFIVDYAYISTGQLSRN